MTAWLRIALAAQVLFFSVWGASLLRSHAHVRVVWLSTEPIDPRDLLSGHYVALRYLIASPSTPDCKALVAAGDATPIYVQLVVSGPPVVTPEGVGMESQAVACRRDPPPADADATWIAGRVGGDGRRGTVTYGIERFYIPETSTLRDARSGSVVAKVAINDASEPRLVDVVPLRQRAN
jgi:uncharacterized membrane-anchored protein